MFQNSPPLKRLSGRKVLKNTVPVYKKILEKAIKEEKKI
jgi:hypothetical protein